MFIKRLQNGSILHPFIPFYYSSATGKNLFNLKSLVMKKATWVLLVLTASLLATIQQSAIAQDTSGTKKEEKNYKNIIKLNITNPLIFGSRSIIVGYERVVGKYQSFSVNVGTTDFPTLFGDDSVRAKAETGQSGMHFSGDYRFYLAKENKHNTPHGVYLGPYFGYNKFEKENIWTMKSTSGGAPFDVQSTTEMTIVTLGFQLGYQFVLWDRWALDFVFLGPGVASYSIKSILGTNLSDADRQKFFEKLNDALAEKFPGWGWTVDTGEFERTGSTNTTSLGYRYMVQIGFRF